MYRHLLQSVPFSKIRHSELPFYRAEGYGGTPVEEWPMYRFFKRYLEGEREAARENFEDWYREQFVKYHRAPKAKGGMYEGSLYQLIKSRCKELPEVASAECKNAVISERVDERFALLEDVKRHGYELMRAERIDAVRKGGFVYLRGGHHRAAALRVLGFTELPGVLVFPNAFLYNLFCFFRNLRRGKI